MQRVDHIDVPGARQPGEFAFSEHAKADRRRLLWFWAPWCEVCNHEAPAIEQMAADTRGELDVIAIGGRAETPDDLGFVKRHRLRTPIVLFDEPMAAWAEYRIPGQPAGVLLDRSGREGGRWIGAFDTAEVLAAARAL